MIAYIASLSFQTIAVGIQLKRPGDNGVLGHIDAAALADGCAVIAMVKGTLTSTSSADLFYLLEAIR